jgi:hypothetical protein
MAAKAQASASATLVPGSTRDSSTHPDTSATAVITS